MATKWEYKSIIVKTNADKISPECNKLGIDGWELVTAIPVGGLGAGASAAILTFKRPLS